MINKIRAKVRDEIETEILNRSQSEDEIETYLQELERFLSDKNDPYKTWSHIREYPVDAKEGFFAGWKHPFEGYYQRQREAQEAKSREINRKDAVYQAAYDAAWSFHKEHLIVVPNATRPLTNTLSGLADGNFALRRRDNSRLCRCSV